MNVIKYILIAMSAVFIVIGVVIFMAGFMKEIWKMCIMGLNLMWVFSITLINERIKEIEEKIKTDKMNIVIIMSAAFIVIGGVIFVMGFMKGIIGMCMIGAIFMWAFSIMAIFERISEMEKKLEKKHKINKLEGICAVFIIVGSIMCVIGFWEMGILEMSLIGLTIMWASSIIGINERINKIRKNVTIQKV